MQYLDFKGVTKYQFYQQVGVANGFLDKAGTIGANKCEKIISVYPDMSLEWLITGKGPMIRPTDPGTPAWVNELLEEVAGMRSHIDALELKIRESRDATKMQ